MSNNIFIETYGCQMNVADSEIVATVLQKNKFNMVFKPEEADIILINTCSIRDNAEQKIFKRLQELNSLRTKNKKLKIGVIGCMAERVGEEFFEHSVEVNFIAGPDSYRNIAEIIYKSDTERVSDILLSDTETYEDILPKRTLTNSISAFVPVMRGCENFCSYCVVPYLRGKERSRTTDSVLKEIENHINNGIKEITLLGQNVNSYHYNNTNFAKLLKEIAQKFPAPRLRYLTSHPKDLSTELLETIAKYDNISKSIHLPLQSGSNSVLERMNRKYTKETYKKLIDNICKIIPECTISTDIIAGFCGETEQDHKETLELMKYAKYYYAFMFKYNERPGTTAAKNFKNDISDELKTKRLNEIIDLQQQLSLNHNKQDIGKSYKVLIEGYSKRSNNFLMGRTSQNKVVVFPYDELTDTKISAGDTVNVKIIDCTSATLKGVIIA